MNNPFNVTKASEYSDEQINNYWVSIGGKKVLDPLDFTPKYILGGKGCGKTHLLRYYSYSLQKLRNGGIMDVVANDRYIGIYSILSTIDAGRFQGKGLTKDQWEAVFKFYFELYIGSFLLNIVAEFITSEEGRSGEEDFVKAVAGLFLNEINLDSFGFGSLLDYVKKQRKLIDLKIENVAFSGDFHDVEINLKSGSLIFGIPEELGRVYNVFHDVEFIYILDEYEKLLDWQKRYVNSLVWEKKYPSTFWVGARKYGYTDMSTVTGEMLKKGSEYIPFFLDEYFQNKEKEYDQFARQLITKRLNRSDEGAIKELEIKFKNGKEEVISSIMQKKKGDYKHLKTLASEIKKAINRHQVLDKEKDIASILDNIIADTNNNPLEQKYKAYLLYQMWADSSINRLSLLSEKVRDEYKEHINNKATRFDNIIEKYTSDFIAQLCEENSIEFYAYSGLDDFIKLSWGNPRVLLLLLKQTIEKSEIFHEHPLESEGFISLRAQYIGIKETSRWYLGDTELKGEDGSYINTAINNLANYFRLYRFADKPTDTSVCAFNYGTENISVNAQLLIRMMELHSLLIKIDNDRKQKNTGKAETTYQLNRILAPHWNLPSARRGIADFSKSVIEAIFDHESFDKFDSEYKLLKSRMNAPFLQKGTHDMDPLFPEK